MQEIVDKNKIQNEEDFELVRKVINGDINAYRFLQKKYNRIISSLIRRMIRNEADVQDLTQETFIKAYNHLSSFQFGYSFSSWIYRIASNTCIDFLRKKRITAISISQVSTSSEEEYEIEIEDRNFLPDIKMMSEEKAKALSNAINSLPENYKEIIKLRHEEELDYNQIAERLDLPLGTVKAHLFRARKILYNNLKKYRYLFLDN